MVTLTTKPAEYDTLGNIVHPEFISKSLNYNAFIAILMKGIQEQQKGMDSLQNENDMQDSINEYLTKNDSILDYRLTQLESALNACCENRSSQTNGSSSQTNSNSAAQISAQNVELKDGQSIVLEQNVPNPFAEQTTINFFLPDNVKKAQMLFYNSQGKLIQSIDLNERGKSSLNVFAQDLSNGIYTYTLVVDGKVVETKKMLKQQ